MWASEATATATASAIDFVAKQVILFVIIMYFLYVSAYECRVGSVRDCSSEQQFGKITAKLTNVPKSQVPRADLHVRRQKTLQSPAKKPRMFKNNLLVRKDGAIRKPKMSEL